MDFVTFNTQNLKYLFSYFYFQELELLLFYEKSKIDKFPHFFIPFFKVFSNKKVEL